MQLIKAASLLISGFALALVVGCRGASPRGGPKTVPVRGKINFTRGGDVKSLANREGRVEFQSIEQPSVRAVGAIEEDGSFTVSTITEEGGSVGALAGSHRVRLDLDEQSTKLVAPQFLSFDKSGIVVKLPSEQPIEINVWK
jgi:hypothetical protein